MEIPQIEVRDAAALLGEGGALALDVREPFEWADAHIEGALLIPLGELAGRLAEVPQGLRIVVVCHSGARSASVTGPLRERGFDAVNLRGGILAWRGAGLPLVLDGEGGS